MVTRTYLVQHHIRIDIRCTRQGSRLSIPISQSSWHSSSCQHPHQHGCCIYFRWTCHSHLQQSKNINGHYTPSWHSVTITTGYCWSKCTPASHRRLKKFYYQCKIKKKIYSANKSPKGCSMAKHISMKLTLSPTPMVSFTNMPWMPPNNFWC